MVVSEDPEGVSIRIIHVARDIADRKLTEEKQREMESIVQHSQKLDYVYSG
ncbi:MAG: hypothetical protein KAR40_16015 [Candidatus Sabulitectum sp.]|nr:hypothetical protein [Candidatus Sabulitectum sp.]